MKTQQEGRNLLAICLSTGMEVSMMMKTQFDKLIPQGIAMAQTLRLLSIYQNLLFVDIPVMKKTIVSL